VKVWWNVRVKPFRERLWPAPWLFISTALVIPASLLVFLPINPTAGLIVAIGLYALCVGGLLASAPTVEVTATELHAGRAHLPLDIVVAATAFTGHEAQAERGQRLDARAWLLIRGWVSPVVRVDIDDPSDPTPYWLISTRRPDELAAVLTARGAQPS
jgi:hypothetical protein